MQKLESPIPKPPPIVHDDDNSEDITGDSDYDNESDEDWIGLVFHVYQ